MVNQMKINKKISKNKLKHITDLEIDRGKSKQTKTQKNNDTTTEGGNCCSLKRPANNHGAKETQVKTIKQTKGGNQQHKIRISE